MQFPPPGYRAHGAPQSDSTTSITLTLSGTTTAATTVCPGATYALSAGWSGFRLGIITSNAGTMSTANNPSCPNRFYTSGSTGVAAPSTSLTVPCASNIPNSSLIIEVTSASFSSDFYRYTSLTLPVNAQCSVGACVAGPPPSPLPPSSTPNTPPNPSPPKPSPPLPSPPPVQITSPPPSPNPPGNISLKCDASVFGYQCQKVTEIALWLPTHSIVRISKI